MSNCQIICIGDELLLGDTVNTNARWLAKNLTGVGASVTAVHTVSDDEHSIKQTLQRAIQESDLVVTTGGLGPTEDDITKDVITKMFESKLMIHKPTFDFIKKRFSQRNIPFSRSNYLQAEVPANAQVLSNMQGTAPGLWFEEDNCKIVVLPGIPFEMKTLTRKYILPKVEEWTKNAEKSFFKYIHTAGVGESTLSDKIIGPLHKFLSHEITVAWLPSPEINTIRITTRAKSKRAADKLSKNLTAYIYKKAENYIIGEGKNCTLSKAVGNLLANNKFSISVAESCTGGALADKITDAPGSSRYMAGGIIAYDNRIKVKVLGVKKKVLDEYGAVSKQAALQMAKNIAQIMGTDIGIATTGIAGPGGGTYKKPVGTVWIGFWLQEQHFALQALFTNDRLINKKRTTAVALEMVRRAVLKIEPMPYGLKPQFAS